MNIVPEVAPEVAPEEDYSEAVIFTALGIINILASGYIVFKYFVTRKMQVHPSGIIVSIALCELGLTYHCLIYL